MNERDPVYQTLVVGTLSSRRGLPPVWLAVGVDGSQAASAAYSMISNSTGVTLHRAY